MVEIFPAAFYSGRLEIPIGFSPEKLSRRSRNPEDVNKQKFEYKDKARTSLKGVLKRVQ